jgi:adenine C2-methylase RlmN of 23S rRNA A2503 and tRNA A37
MTHQSMFDLSMDKVTISTVGVVSRIRQLADECPAVNLAISLHAGNQVSATVSWRLGRPLPRRPS